MEKKFTFRERKRNVDLDQFEFWFMRDQGSNVWVMYNGNLIKLAECRVQPVHSELGITDSKQMNETNRVSFQNCNNTANEESEIEDLENFEDNQTINNSQDNRTINNSQDN